jgi:hypothetical protein
LGKTFFGSLIKVPLGETKTVEFSYTLPKNINGDFYDLKIQKQPGINDVPVKVHVTDKNGAQNDYEFTMNSDIVLSKVK